MCELVFCTNSKCSFSIHAVLADAVESNAGSGHLLKILNCLGACVSSDTLLRYQQHRIKQLEEAGNMSEYPSTAFTVVLADKTSISSTAMRGCTVEINNSVGMEQLYKQCSHSHQCLPTPHALAYLI